MDNLIVANERHGLKKTCKEKGDALLPKKIGFLGHPHFSVHEASAFFKEIRMYKILNKKWSEGALAPCGKSEPSETPQILACLRRRAAPAASEQPKRNC
ncbi:hypothetical protein JOC27_001532 [Sporolactobacillus spathodeae]|uniref:Uncharacterized protein n=1 Tax=Sporolactobacillus spathodeae TaxID=1465502 RepID=A0ABS2Q9G0_9BACL|nr:hypothetical protein [Sporolactobacillus spathodeae]